jgi:maltose O-acetyltransferase
MKVTRVFWLVFYYVIIFYLPRNENKILGRLVFNVRKEAIKNIFKKVGDNAVVNRGVYFGSGKNIIIGDNSGIGENCQISNDIIIGNDVMIAPECIMFSKSHNIDNLNIPMKEQGETMGNPVKIGNDVWICQRAIILPGKVVNSGSIIGAGSLVTRDIDYMEVVGGNPVQHIRYRNER